MGSEQKPFLNRPNFSVNDYDDECDITEYGIYFHFGETRIRICEDVDGLAMFKEHIDKIEKEIRENY